MPVQGRGVVITGAGGGIGAALAKRMVDAGARVVVNDIDETAVHAVATSVGATAIAGDCASEAGVARLIEQSRDVLGAIDVYFANAGVEVGGGLDASEADWARTIDINVMAHIRAARLLVPEWLGRGEGRFIVTASAAGLLTMLGSAPYSVSKHASVAFAEWLSATYGHRGITVQAICPQGVRTRMLDQSAILREILSHDDALEPDELAERVYQGMVEGGFLILPHPEVAGYYLTRASQTDRWLGGMRKLQKRIDEATA